MPYQGFVNLRSANEKIEYTPKMIEEFVKCQNDIVYFAENYFKIVTIDEGERIIKLWDFQKKILKSFINDEPRHKAVLSSRQIGKTTISSIYLLWYILFNKDKTVAVLANKELVSKEILRRIRMAYQNLPQWLQAGIAEGGWNQMSITLGNGSRIFANTTSSSSVRGETISLLYLDEFAFVPQSQANEFMASVFPTISSGKTSKIIIVSTPNGMNHFYDIWRNAIRKENNFQAIKVNWWEVPGRDEKWKEETLKALNNDIVKFNQEYSCKFLGSSQTLIDPDVLERCETLEPIDYKMGYLMSVWEHPIDKQMYILGVDSAKGTNRDYSVIQVLKIIDEHTVEQVAVYSNNTIETYGFAQVCIEVSKYFNEAWMMVENNAEGGEVANIIWYTFEYGNILNCDKKGLGIRSTKKNKLSANLMLKRYLENGWLTVKDKQTVVEMSKYEEITPNVFQAGQSDHDDRVTSLYWALYFLATPFYDGRNNIVREVDNQYKIELNDEPPIIIFDEGQQPNEHNF